VTPVKDSVTALLAESGSSPFPKGTRLLSVDIKDGVAALDFSKEFNRLANSGDSTESQAQKALCAALAKFPDVQKMHVTVEGKSFDSQAGGEGQGGGQ
jgi:spore germination protein GerM